MIISLALVLPFLFLALLLFAKLRPQTSNLAALSSFNRTVWCISAVAAVATCVYFWATTGHSSDTPWWPYLAVLGSMLMVGLVLILGAIGRLLFFRSDRQAS